jgi:hypothetical protein
MRHNGGAEYHEGYPTEGRLHSWPERLGGEFACLCRFWRDLRGTIYGEPRRKFMNAVEATVQNRRIEVSAPDDWPDGTKVMVDVVPVPVGNRLDDVDFMTEDEQSDDPDVIKRWIAELEALPGITMNPEEEMEMLAWRRKEKEFNLEAARREMAKEIP